MKKILIVNSFYYPTIVGGAEISTQLLAEGLSDDYDVHVLTTGQHKAEVQKEEINKVTVHRIPNLNIYSPLERENKGSIQKLMWHLINLYNPKQMELLMNILKDLKPDLLHTQNVMGIGSYVWDIAKKLSIPVVHTTRDYALVEPVNSGLINTMTHKKNIQRSKSVDTVVGISKYILDYHKDKGLFSGSDNNIIGNVVNAEPFTRKEKKENAPLTVGYFGQVSANKGILSLIKAIRSLDSTIVEKVVICGTGDSIEEVKNAAKEDYRIELKGKISQEEVYQQMANVDVTVVPSVWAEPFGRVIIESYQQGTPVIATAVGGIPELILNKKMLVEKDNEEALKHKLKWFQSLSYDEHKKLIRTSYDESMKYRDNLKDYKNVYKKLI